MPKKCVATECTNCTAPAPDQQCSRCLAAVYCSRTCQKQHWPDHKLVCTPLEKRKPRAEETVRDRGDAECAICLASILPTSLCRLPCAHLYHTECMAAFRKYGSKQQCPLCRTKLPDKAEKLFEEATFLFVKLIDKPVLSALEKTQMEEVVSKYRIAADLGFASAQLNLASIYDDGVHVEQNDAFAVELYTRAANHGLDKAQYNIGVMYHIGKGVPKDLAAALSWYLKAAAQGFAVAQFSVGEYYYLGELVDLDYTEAYRWMLKAALQGFGKAQLIVGQMHFFGKGVPKDDAEALTWFKRAVDNNTPEALYCMGFFYQNSTMFQNHPKALKWFFKAAEVGDLEAEYTIAVYYMKGYVGPVNHELALKWFTRAAESGHGKSQNNLAVMYANGLGTAASQETATHWIQKCVAQGFDFQAHYDNELERLWWTDFRRSV